MRCSRLQAAGKIAGEIDLARVTVELPRDPTHGDLSTNAAMVLSKSLGREAAGPGRADCRGAAQPIAMCGRWTSPDPGFINLHLAEAFWQARIGDILAAGSALWRLQRSGKAAR